MTTKIQNGKIEFDLADLFEGMDEQSKLVLIESLACERDVVKHVTAQILDKWTENGYYGPVQCTASSDPHLGLDWAWREVAKRSSEVAAREIARLEDAIRAKDKEIAELYER